MFRPKKRTPLERQAAMIAAILFFTVLVGYLARVCLSVALPYVSADFGWNSQQTGSFGGVLLGIFLVGYGLSNIFLSPLVDCYGPRKGLLVAVTIWSLLTLLTGIVGVYYSVFVLLRVLLGASQGILFPAASKVTQAWFPPNERSRMNAVYHSSIAVSNILSPLLLLPLIMLTNWNFMFFVVALLGFIMLVPIFFMLRDSPGHLTECNQKTLRENLTYTKDNLKESMKVKGLPRLTLALTCASLVWWGLSLWLPTFLLLARGFTPDELIWGASVPYFGYLAGLLVGSWLSDRTGRTAQVTGAFSAMGALMLLIVYLVHGKLEVVAAMSLTFFFLPLMSPNTFTLLQGTCASRLCCSATGIVNGLATGIAALGPILFGAAASLTGSYDSALPIMIVLLLIASITIVRYRPVCPLDKDPAR